MAAKSSFFDGAGIRLFRVRSFSLPYSSWSYSWLGLEWSLSKPLTFLAYISRYLSSLLIFRKRENSQLRVYPSLKSGSSFDYLTLDRFTKDFLPSCLVVDISITKSWEKCERRLWNGLIPTCSFLPLVPSATWLTLERRERGGAQKILFPSSLLIFQSTNNLFLCF